VTARRRRILAVLYGVACHGTFLLAVGLMVRGLLTGMASGIGRLSGAPALVSNALLIAQFPLLHSFLLTRRGRGGLARLAPSGLGQTLGPTTFALVAAVQLIATFLLWSPSGVLLWQPTGTVKLLHGAAFVGAWVFLGKALYDAGIGLQTGWIGWIAAWRGERPAYPGLPETGLFARCRQPIYLGFGLTLWTAPVWTLDHLAVALVWGAYCVVGPLLKERRFASIYGKDFAAYRQRVPYLVPRLFS